MSEVKTTTRGVVVALLAVLTLAVFTLVLYHAQQPEMFNRVGCFNKKGEAMIQANDATVKHERGSIRIESRGTTVVFSGSYQCISVKG